VLVALTTDQQVGLATTAAIFIAFSLLAALVIPRANPDFPGRRGLVPFIIVTLALTIAMLGAVEVWAKEDHAAAEGAHETTPTEPPPPAEPPPPPGEPPPPTTTGAGEPSGSAQAGRAVFVDSGCGNCHTFQPAGTTGTVGPDLSEVLAGQDAAFIRESIVDPNAEIASGYSAGVMPETYEDQLSPQQLNDLVAFLASG
jgi:cytochrome c551/c552